MFLCLPKGPSQPYKKPRRQKQAEDLWLLLWLFLFSAVCRLKGDRGKNYRINSFYLSRGCRAWKF
jgi:hypothetical protein